ncbi:MAG: DUF4118 domain-containing protein [Candidatus Rokubacteria bacterium]|nr:DUF4118 domain-containing protein [Candidatus Rokubacteria bacterium]
MSREEGIGVWLPAGVFGAIALAVGLIPLRAVTSASNLAFVFMALTIVVAEVGGRGAALATATVSAMSLNFFLTAPYLTLMISKTDDIIAFAALAACGLIAAAFGTRREHWSETASRARQELDVLERLADHLRAGTPLDDILNDLRRAFGLGALVLRDADEHVLATAPPGAASVLIPQARLKPRALLAQDEAEYWLGLRGFRLPEGGGRLPLHTDRGLVSLDLWEGDPQGLDLDERRTLWIAASVLALELSHRYPGSRHRASD